MNSLIQIIISMFKSEKTNDFKEAETIIGPSVKVEGDFVSQGNLIVDGVIKGNVKTNGNLRVGDKAKVTASVSAANALISGEIHGNVTIKEDLELTSNAKIFGDIQAKSVCIARGAILNGKCTMTEEETKKEGTKKDKKIEDMDKDENINITEKKESIS